MSEDIEDITEKIAEKLELCSKLLLECEEEDKKCKKCKDKDNCLLFIRSVVSALCKIEVARMSIPENETPEGMYL